MKLYPCAVLLLSFSFLGHTSVPIHGTFQAQKACQAYLSKKRKTNPDDYRLTPNQTYNFVEANTTFPSDWYRVTIHQEQHPLRWVNTSCGIVNVPDDVENSQCNKKAGFADSYILALSWLPAFCETFGYDQGKAECYSLSRNSYTYTHFALHGLWPNQKACGKNYCYCQTKKKKRHCDYPGVRISEMVASELVEMMPSYASGSCLERHEWYRHGTCQTLSQDDYFHTGIQLAQRFNNTSLVKMIRNFSGSFVTLRKLNQAFITDFGQDAAGKLYLGCKHGMLVDVWISLPANMSVLIQINDMIQQAPKIGRSNTCPENIYISEFFN